MINKDYLKGVIKDNKEYVEENNINVIDLINKIEKDKDYTEIEKEIIIDLCSSNLDCNYDYLQDSNNENEIENIEEENEVLNKIIEYFNK